ncbi:hypothetical protein EOL70_19925 [Leucothrix sargassi]|nr:hypothetical protein EOL70_19925 [Leucothrix sargassi]
MELLKTSTDWARTELFSTSLFIVFGVAFLLVSIAFWQVGKTDIAKAYIIPTLVAGALLLIIGLGLTYTNNSRIVEFEQAYNANVQTFIDSEIARAEATLKEYKTVVFTAIPLIISVCALLLIFMSAPVWRASLITTIAMLAIILLVDGTAHGRMEVYYDKLMAAKTL